LNDTLCLLSSLKSRFWTSCALPHLMNLITKSLKNGFVTYTTRSTSYLDLHPPIDSEGWWRTKHSDKRYDFNFPIVNFPFIYSNIPASPAYGVYISQLIRYSRVCGSYQDLLDRGLLLTRKLRNQWFILVKLKSWLRTSYRHHHELVSRYEMSVSQMTTDMFLLSSTLSGNVLIHDLSPVCN
jgi:hypothetical protein